MQSLRCDQLQRGHLHPRFISAMSSAQTSSSAETSPFNTERLPFFVYGTLCTGFVNWKHFIQHRNLEARAARLSGYVVVDFPDRGYPGMYAASSPLLPAFDGGAVAREEVVGELVDASRLSSEEYDRLLGELDRLEDFNGPQHPDNM